MFEIARAVDDLDLEHDVGTRVKDNYETINMGNWERSPSPAVVDLNRSQGLGGSLGLQLYIPFLGIRDISDDKLSKWKHLANWGDKKIRTKCKTKAKTGTYLHSVITTLYDHIIIIVIHMVPTTRLQSY